MKTEEEIARMLDEEIALASDWLRQRVQPYLLGPPERIYGMAVALQRLGVEVVMQMVPEGHDAYAEGIGSLDAMRKQLVDMRDSGMAPPERALELPTREVLSPTSKA